ncbi:hypothetical protein ELG77_08880 [Rhizobium leguminosarum]|uniref:hypothetical protein n=1 Tax=Rhizobium leguminosarum TaxID=384 RepID=UPI001030F8D9|nr:hypothetical protein [Rhizobium leguminosarum]TBG41875.1 hypothetical protein ELG77_08880 [Rhizobium leguminosarum]
MNAINITKADIGRKVRMSDGKTLTIEGWDDEDRILPVHLGGSVYRKTDGGTLIDGLAHISAFIESEDMNDKQSLTLEVGKYYRMRNGRKAIVTCDSGANPFGGEDDKFPLNGYADGFEAGICWTAKGKTSGWNSECDIIGAWVEPQRIMGWLAICSADNGQIIYPGRQMHPTAAIALEANPNAIACIEIDVLEGAGLEGEVA